MARHTNEGGKVKTVGQALAEELCETILKLDEEIGEFSPPGDYMSAADWRCLVTMARDARGELRNGR